MSVDLKAGIVRVLKPNGETSGTSFVVTDDGLIATCAHVVEAAGSGPGDTVRVVFHTTGEQREAQVEQDWWRDPDAEDVAILRLEGPLPEGVTPLLLGSSGGTSGHPFRTFGFPDASPEEGIWGDGHILEATTMQGVQVLQLSSPQITPGFSGAPVWDERTRRVVGMVTSIATPDRYGRLAETAFITPTETLRAVCTDLQLSDLCPYKGLAAFTKDDEEFFYGRDELVTELVRQLRENPRFLAVIGPSGSGKSSLVQAGLYPALSDGKVPGSEDWHLLSPCQPKSNPFAALTAIGLKVPQDGDLRTAVSAFLGEHPQATRLILFADQFEQLFTLCPEPVQKHFLDRLIELLESGARVTIILALRADFYGHLLRHQPLMHWLKDGQVNVPPMGPEELRAAMEKPARKIGLRFEPGLVATIVKEAGEVKYPLPLLESALTQLWRKREDGVLTHAAYEVVGRVAGAIGLWAEDAYSGLRAEEQSLAQRVFTRSVHYGEGDVADTRQWRTLADLVSRPTEKGAVHQLVKQLADARLLVTAQDPGTTEETVNIIHDALLGEWGRLRRWITEQRGFLLWRQRLGERLQEWEEKGQDQGALLHGALLTEAERRLKERPDDLNPDEQHYIEESVALRESEREARLAQRLREQQRELEAAEAKAREQEQRKVAANLRRLAALLAGAVLVAIVLTIVTFALFRRSERLGREALSYKLATQALEYLELEPQRSLLLAVEAIRTTKEADGTRIAIVEQSLRKVLASTGELPLRGEEGSSLTLPKDKGAILAVAHTPERHWLVTKSSDWTVRLWDLTDLTTETRVFSGHEGDITAVAFSPNGQWLATGSEDDTVRLWDLTDPAAESVALRAPISQSEADSLGEGAYDHVGDILSVAFSPTGRWLATGYPIPVVHLWDLEDLKAEPRILFGHIDDNVWEPSSIEALAFSLNGDQLAAGSSDSTVRLWDSEFGEFFLGYSKPVDLTGHEDAVVAMTFSPDGRWLATGDEDNTVRLWNVGKPRAKPIVMHEHEKGVVTLAFSSDGRWLATGSKDNTVRLWDMSAPTAKPVTLRGHKNEVITVAFSPDGSSLTTGSADNQVRFWLVELDELIELACHTAGRNLTQMEWEQFMGRQEYRPTCPDLPVPGE